MNTDEDMVIAMASAISPIVEMKTISSLFVIINQTKKWKGKLKF